jgi:hypothetical protein
MEKFLIRAACMFTGSRFAGALAAITPIGFWMMVHSRESQPPVGSPHRWYSHPPKRANSGNAVYHLCDRSR